MHLVVTSVAFIWVADVYFQPSGHTFTDDYFAFTAQGGLNAIMHIKAFIIFKALQKYKVLALYYLKMHSSKF